MGAGVVGGVVIGEGHLIGMLLRWRRELGLGLARGLGCPVRRLLLRWRGPRWRIVGCLVGVL